MTSANILGSIARIFIDRRQSARRTFTSRPLFPKLFKERSAPSAARARSVAFTQLGRSTRFFDANVVRHLAVGDVETETKFVVGLHGSTLPSETMEH